MESKAAASRCVCGHAKRNHIDGHGMCLVKSCKRPFCRGYRDAGVMR